MLMLAIRIYSFIVLGAVILSWVRPPADHPLVRLIHGLTEPVLAPIRKVLPPMGGFDLSPLALLLGLQLLARLL